MNDKLNQEVILNQEDLLIMLDGLLEKWDEEWWNEFYSDKEKPIPFFIDLPDENLVTYFERSFFDIGRALDIGCGNGRNSRFIASKGYFGLVCFNLNGGANLSDHDVYKKFSMDGGLGYSDTKLKKILEPYFNIIEFRQMRECYGELVFGKNICWSVLMRKISK